MAVAWVHRFDASSAMVHTLKSYKKASSVRVHQWRDDMLNCPMSFHFLHGSPTNYSGTEEFQSFVKLFSAAMRVIESTPLEGMVREICNSKHVVNVRQIKVASSTCDVNKSLADNVCYLEVLDDKAMHARLVKLANDDKSARSIGLLHAYRKLGIKPPLKPLSDKEVSLPIFAVDHETRCRAAYWIRDHLEPGPGAAVDVKWNCVETTILEEAKWGTRPPWISLAHELIHAWRWCTGRAVFHPARTPEYYEEAMTVGLPPYDGCKYTENLVRESKGQERRTYYGPSDKDRSLKRSDKDYSNPPGL